MKKIQSQILILVLISIITAGCGKKITEYSKQAEYVFINKTAYSITYIKNSETYNVGPSATMTVKITTDGSENVQASEYMSPFGDNEAYKNSGIKFIVKFDGNRCWEPPFEGSHSPLDIKSYSNERIATNNYKFTYTFTDDDYNRAVNCP
ncbi:hypothetical protein EZJ43_12670 [Pedobacter changchengzhani]|uniref:Uncharacterized protein n=1 Tax=Pedobacter changchengzhani TaxID=2529274 RepID=A0A4R5MJU7_9SPHI|nr:hypothetical protein [Pedobacter changchengzhani]TDG35475.1 hypothetical protein EZJ43_12670 [Pedobacter changchengzhani]